MEIKTINQPLALNIKYIDLNNGLIQCLMGHLFHNLQSSLSINTIYVLISVLDFLWETN